jgi:16S rRNA (uracil1498-N3)-methyltransferase
LLLDGSGLAYRVRLELLSKLTVRGTIEERLAAGGEPPFDLTLYTALLRGERFEWVLQKCTELGVRRIVPVQFKRSLVAERIDAKKLDRWRRIVREAAEQSCRARLPELDEPINFDTACVEAAKQPAYLLWEGEAAPLRSALPVQPGALAILSGPEGGISEDELTAAHERGIIPVSLGPRILRAETAPVAALAAISVMYE